MAFDLIPKDPRAPSEELPGAPLKQIITHRFLQTCDQRADRGLGTAHIASRLSH